MLICHWCILSYSYNSNRAFGLSPCIVSSLSETHSESTQSQFARLRLSLFADYSLKIAYFYSNLVNDAKLMLTVQFGPSLSSTGSLEIGYFGLEIIHLFITVKYISDMSLMKIFWKLSKNFIDDFFRKKWLLDHRRWKTSFYSKIHIIYSERPLPIRRVEIYLGTVTEKLVLVWKRMSSTCFICSYVGNLWNVLNRRPLWHQSSQQLRSVLGTY